MNVLDSYKNLFSDTVLYAQYPKLIELHLFI